MCDGPERAVEADAQQVRVRDRVPEGFDRLARERAAALEDRDRGHHRQANRLDRRSTSRWRTARPSAPACRTPFRAAGYRRPLRPARRPARSTSSTIWSNVVVAVAGIVHVAGDRKLPVRRADRAGDEPRLVGRAAVPVVGRFAGQLAGGQVQLADVDRPRPKSCHRHVRRAERVRLDDVGAGFEVLAVDLPDRLGLRDAEDIDEVLQVLRSVGELPCRDSRPRRTSS